MGGGANVDVTPLDSGSSGPQVSTTPPSDGGVSPGPQALGPTPPSSDGGVDPGSEAQAPTTPPGAGGVSPGPQSAPAPNKIKDTLSNAKNDKKQDEEKDKSWSSQMNALSQGYMDKMVKPFNDKLSKGLFGATLDDFWDDPKKAAQSMEEQIVSNVKDVGKALSGVKDKMANLFNKDNAPAASKIEASQLSPAPDSITPQTAQQQVSAMDTSQTLDKAPKSDTSPPAETPSLDQPSPPSMGG